MVPNSLGPGELLLALRHRRAEAPLPAAPREGARDPVLRAHQSVRGLGRGVDSRLRDRLLGRARGQARARPARHVGQALHHARPGRDAARSRVPRLRSRPAASATTRTSASPARSIPTDASGRAHRPPPHAAQRGVPERSQLGQRRLHPDGLGDRRAADARPRLADADGVPRRRARHLAAVVEHRHGEARGARDRRLCARAHAVQDADRQVRGHRGAARAHGRQPLHDGRDAHAHRAARSTSARSPRCCRASPSTTSPSAAARSINDAMDIAGGKGICMGPSNFLGAALHADAGVDHRRGREHPDAQPDRLRPGRDPLPSLRAEGDARPRASADAAKASIAFDEALFGHVALRAVELGAHVRDGASPARTSCACPTDVAPETRRYYQQLTRFSAALAFLADVSMGALGGALKRKEKLSARLGDILSLLYLCSATLKRYEARGPAGTPTRRSCTGRSGTRCSRRRTRSRA